MSEREPEVINSKLSRRFEWVGYRLSIEIYRLDDRPGWTLEVINEAGTSVVWNDQFATDRDADNAFRETLATEGLAAFLDDDEGNVIPFPSGRLH
jgi:hypothetical protein